MRLADAHGYAIWAALAQIFHGAANARPGNRDGLAEMEEGFTLYQQLSAPPVFWPEVLVIRATTHAAGGDVDRALSH